ncbi:MAG: helix-turn-helix domain-containing protein [Bacteroidota bacterium]
MNPEIAKQKKRVVCPVELALRILGGKWRGSILYQLIGGPLAFNALKDRVQDAVVCNSLEEDHYLSAKVLAEHLAMLQEYELVVKIPANGTNGTSAHAYSLTEKGKSAVPLLMDLFDWGNTFY